MEKRPLVLIVDDHPSARHTLEALLSGQGYDLVFSISGPEALEQLESLEPDVILLDVMLPVMDGFEVCKRIKSDDNTRDVPVLLVTALETKEALAHGFEAGADDFLTKPVSGIELRARVRSMLRIKQQYDALKETLKMRENMANMIIHDMRNPLTTISGHAELLSRRVEDPAIRKSLETVKTQSRRLNSSLNDMLMLAKMEAGGPILNRRSQDVGELIHTVQAGLEVVASANNVSIDVDIPEDSHQLELDSNLFGRVLDNLLSNAIAYSPDGGTVTIRLEYADQVDRPEWEMFKARVSVLDQGPGVAEDQREVIFEKFGTGREGKRKGAQVGLGLAFCRMVVDAHGGKIYVTDNEPNGAIFTVEL